MADAPTLCDALGAFIEAGTSDRTFSAILGEELGGEFTVYRSTLTLPGALGCEIEPDTDRSSVVRCTMYETDDDEAVLAYWEETAKALAECLSGWTWSFDDYAWRWDPPDDIDAPPVRVRWGDTFYDDGHGYDVLVVVNPPTF